MAKALKAGLDIGSTTVKLSILNSDNKPVYCKYKRHQLDLINTVISLIDEAPKNILDEPISICAAGSGAIGISQKIKIDFEQEVIACSRAIKEFMPQADVAIELGGEDAKITFFDKNSIDQRMNETCAGGTGAFIDQMAQTLKTDAGGINELAKNHKTVYPIAARCGVFAKTDIMPLLNEGAAKEDIAASVLQAVVNQTIGGLARGRTIKGNVLLLGGPLFFLSELRQCFAKSLKLPPENVFFPENAHFFVSFGAAILGGENFEKKMLEQRREIDGERKPQSSPHSPLSKGGAREADNNPSPFKRGAANATALIAAFHVDNSPLSKVGADKAVNSPLLKVGADKAVNSPLSKGGADKAGEQPPFQRGCPPKADGGLSPNSNPERNDQPLKVGGEMASQSVLRASEGAAPTTQSSMRASEGAAPTTQSSMRASEALAHAMQFHGGETLNTLKQKLESLKSESVYLNTSSLKPLFADKQEHEDFLKRHSHAKAKRTALENVSGELFLGIDAGSTTTKAVLITRQKEIAYSHYGPNKGNPLQSAIDILKDIYSKLPFEAKIAGSCITGYGEALIKSALGFDYGEVETIAHYKAASFFNPEVSFILDIGGQDMKCIYVKNGLIDKIVLNEACSSGCGSFIENFAQSLNYSVSDFAALAIEAKNPVDLGSRCTVFMNSKIKQAQKEGANAGDISAGLNYSVIKNALYKVIKIGSPKELGGNIVVQGGTFFNDGILRAAEILLGAEVSRPDIAGLMGAFGASLIALQHKPAISSTISKEKLETFVCKTRNTRCKGCENKCLLNIALFPDGKTFISGNRCENALKDKKTGTFAFNMFDYKYKRLFDFYKPLPLEKAPRGEIGLPRALNMFENYPFWFEFFTALGFRVVVSDQSSNALFNEGLESIPSQTVCFPAKMVHGHIENLVKKGVKTIFYPCIPFEIQEFKEADNHYNCPVVGGYPEVVRLNMNVLEEKGIKFLQPFLPFNDTKRLILRLNQELKDYQISKSELIHAVLKGRAALNLFKKDIRKTGAKYIKEIKAGALPAIILAGRPYHIDPAINHGIADLISSHGMIVLSEDSVAHLSDVLPRINFVDQWMYHSRLYRAAHFAASLESVELIQLNSFGCGLDAITTEQTEDILSKSSKIYTVLKIDEGSNLGAVKIRIRSLLAAIKERKGLKFSKDIFMGDKFAPFTKDMRSTHTILCPQMSPIHFRLAGSIMKKHNINLEVLPKVSKEDIEEGLRYVNNDACYPTIVVVGQLINALKSGRYDIEKTALIISQTGGGCRATNYGAFLRKAAKKAGFDNVPIIVLGVTNTAVNKAFKFSLGLIKDVVFVLLYGDLLMRLSNRMRPYEITAGQTDAMVEKWLIYLSARIRKTYLFEFGDTVRVIIEDFDSIPIKKIKKPRVGIVGEILVKFHPDANNNLVSVLEKEGAEAIIPDMMDFLIYCLLDDVYKHKYLSGSLKNRIVSRIAVGFIEKQRQVIRRALKKSKHFVSYHKTKELADKASEIISVCNQTGEGWLLTAEMLELIEDGVNNIVCIQPFGCLPNHITGKGVLKELRRRYENVNIAAVDYDPGASEVNQINRIKLMMSAARQAERVS